MALIAGCTAPPPVTSSPAPTPRPTRDQPRTWQDQAIYFVMTDRFHNGDPSNDGDARPGDLGWWQGGDLRGVIQKLPYIKDLGMTAVRIAPATAQTRGGYHGYWTDDFYAVDPHLGDMATLKELVTKAHELGLKVILDIVINHVGYDHRWLTERPTWFHERCEISEADPRSVEVCWLAGLPDLNTEFPEVQRYLMDWSVWLARETRVDGYHLHAARHVPREFIARWSNALETYVPGFWVVGDVTTPDLSEQAAYFIEAKLDAVTDVHTYESVRLALGGERADLSRLALPPQLTAQYLARPGARATFIDDHDVARFVGAGALDDARRTRLELGLAYLLTMPGVPVLQFGTEVALRGAGPDDRRPMPWDDTASAAIREHAKGLATLRQREIALRRGGFQPISADAGHIVFARRYEDDLVVVALNATGEGLTRALPAKDLAIPAGRALRPAFGTDQVPRAEGTDVIVEIPARGAAVWIARPGP